MDDPKKEPTPLNERQDFKLCLNCGFPNRPKDTQCMYCHTSIKDDGGVFSWLQQMYYVLKWRWDLKQKRNPLGQGPNYSLIKSIGFFILGAVLSGSGVILFVDSVSRNTFSNAIIAILLLLYGVYTLKTLFISRE